MIITKRNGNDTQLGLDFSNVLMLLFFVLLEYNS